MNADDHSRSSRRPRPEVAVYRPGSGPLKKSSNNVENIQPSNSSGRSDAGSELASSFRNVTLYESSEPQDSRSKKVNGQKHERNPQKTKADKPVERPKPPKWHASSTERTETGSNQDLRQLIIEKRLQRNNESSGIQPNNNKAQPSKEANGHVPVPELARGKHKNDRRRPSSRSESHLVALSNNPAGPSKNTEEIKVDQDVNKNGRKKRNNRGSRRGSISSDAGTPVPERARRPSGDKTRQRHTSSPHHSRNEIRSSTAGPMSPTAFIRPANPVTSPTHRQSSEPPANQERNVASSSSSQRGSNRDLRNIERQDNYGRPPSGRHRPSLPSNYDSLPPRFKKKFEEERLANRPPDAPKWDGVSLTFMNATGGPAPRPTLPHPFPVRQQRRAGPQRTSDHEEVELVRPRSQDSVSDRERKTSFTDSRSSTPLSSVDCTASQNALRGTLRRLEEVNSTETSLDWSEEMEEEDRRSHAKPIVFASSDIRYQNKPLEGYTVIPNAPSGRPLQGRKTEPPRMSVPGLIQLPSQPEQPRRENPPPRQRVAQRTLFDPANPHKPIVVAQRSEAPSPLLACPELIYQSLPADQGNNTSSKPSWYDLQSESFRTSKSPPPLLMDIIRCDMELSWLLQGPNLAQRFNRIQMNRKFLQNSLRMMLTNDLRFCQMENVEQHMWKLAFHNVIEALRKSMSEEIELKDDYKSLLFTIVDEGSAYFESLLETLQEAHKFNLDTYLEAQPYPMLSGLGYVGLAVISCQKVLIFLGDLARYREITAETTNYGKAKSWYTKANLANPKNGRPYNQLAILALYARRKLDAVYLYMRSLMASNPFQSARESLVSLFDENRKKYEQQERKRREAKDVRLSAPQGRHGALRREIWIHPQDGRRTRRTTSANDPVANSDDEELAQLPSIEVNKRFVTSYLNVQGKLYTKIGMETFQECGVQMLREFRALLQQTPLPVNQARLLQLLALNMFAVSNTQLKDTRMAGGCRSAWQECALIVSLEMFNILLERCNALLKEQLDSGNSAALNNSRLLGEDLQIILPAIKVWCDWLLCHSKVWNPPPTSRDYHVGPAGTPWTRLATLINLLNRFDTRQVPIATQPLEGYEPVKLPEDVALCGFTPLMLNIPEPHYSPKTSDVDLAADCVRIDRLLYFGRDFLCGLDPSVLKLKFTGPNVSEYVSVVDAAPKPARHDAQSLLKDDSEDEGRLLDELEMDDVIVESTTEDSEDLRQLRQRKDELTQKHLDQQSRKQQLKAILQERVQVELEVRPKYLVADTNCYIDHLDALVRLTKEKHYTLVAPLVVLNELDGLGKSRLASEARAALSFLREKNPQIRYVTSKGAPLPNFAACTMNEESDDQGLTNDDRILQCCVGLVKDKPATDDDNQPGADGIRRLSRDVVLLTDDRNLRVKSLSRDVPVRDLPSFLSWAATAVAN